MTPHRPLAAIVAATALVWGSSLSIAESQDPDHKDVVYTSIEGRDLHLDIYLPAGIADPPLVIWIHGGAWSRGSKADVPVFFVEGGFATASIDFRQSTEARFPAQAHDIKTAIRFLRRQHAKYGFRADRIAIAGSSSGGHLAALVGVTSCVAELEGNTEIVRDTSSAIQAIVSYYGASNLTTILSQSTPHGLSVRRPALQSLLGGQPDQMPELARLASPVFHVDQTDPPLLLLHGDQDPQMPINQSHELHDAYRRYGLDVRFDVVHGAAHGGDAFYTGDHARTVLEFLTRTIGRRTAGNVDAASQSCAG